MTPGLVLVNFASTALLAQNVPTAVDARVVVVDNWSSAAERARVDQLGRERGWTVVHSPNDGFGAGVNRGVAAAAALGCERVVLLNPDLRIETDVLAALDRAVAEQPDALVGPRLTDGDGRPHFDGFLCDMKTGRTSRGWPGDGVHDFGWLTAACLALSTRTFMDLGGFDERYFMYWEDVDLSRRAAAAGFPLVLRSDLVAVHDEGGTQNRSERAKSNLYYRYNARNRLLFAAANLERQAVRDWVRATGRQTLDIWLRGGKRQLLSRPSSVVAAFRGALEGLAAVRELRTGSGERRRPGTLDPVPTNPSVTVAVLTYHRNDQIAALVPLLAEQLRAAQDVCRPRLVVVDNDTDAGARPVVAAAISGLDVDASYVHEQQPGLVAARNRALREAAGSDAVVFIDDDERPGASWLPDLVSTWSRTGAWAVSGPVRSEFPATPSRWVLGSGLYDRPRAATGSPRNSAATNNLLLDLRRAREVGLEFDEQMSATGGEDSMLMQTVRRAGGSIVWCDEAEVSETVPLSRMQPAWIRKRSMRFGETWAFVRVVLSRAGVPRMLLRARYAAHGLALTAVHTALAVAARIRRDDFALGRCQTRAAGGWGMVRGALGLRFREYSPGHKRD